MSGYGNRLRASIRSASDNVLREPLTYLEVPQEFLDEANEWPFEEGLAAISASAIARDDDRYHTFAMVSGVRRALNDHGFAVTTVSGCVAEAKRPSMVVWLAGSVFGDPPPMPVDGVRILVVLGVDVEQAVWALRRDLDEDGGTTLNSDSDEAFDWDSIQWDKAAIETQARDALSNA